MAISPDLMLAILAMDSYNRGYGAGLADGEGTPDENGKDPDGLGESGIVGNARILARPNSVAYGDWQSTGFYAIAYEWNGKTIISYRGTDGSPDYLEGWLIGGGVAASWTQTDEVLAFYRAVTGQSYTDGVAENVILTGHSLGGGLAHSQSGDWIFGPGLAIYSPMFA